MSAGRVQSIPAMRRLTLCLCGQAKGLSYNADASVSQPNFANIQSQSLP